MSERKQMDALVEDLQRQTQSLEARWKTKPRNCKVPCSRSNVFRMSSKTIETSARSISKTRKPPWSRPDRSTRESSLTLNNELEMERENVLNVGVRTLGFARSSKIFAVSGTTKCSTAPLGPKRRHGWIFMQDVTNLATKLSMHTMRLRARSFLFCRKSEALRTSVDDVTCRT